jgi:hypothetical protein
VVTGADPVPIQINQGGIVISRPDLATSHEETDNIIVQQVKENTESKITVVADDTDVFVLLVHYYHRVNLKNVVLMESPIKGRTVIDIGKIVQKHSEIVEGILPVHALSGCDTVASYFGIGKGNCYQNSSIRALALIVGYTRQFYGICYSTGYFLYFRMLWTNKL